MLEIKKKGGKSIVSRRQYSLQFVIVIIPKSSISSLFMFVKMKGKYMKILDPKRLLIRITEVKDGIIELKRGVKDIALPEGKKWARVSIPIIDGNYCIHGMAIYSDDLPDGVDVIYNINIYLHPMNKVIRDFPPKFNIQGHHITPKGDSVIWVFDISEELEKYSPTFPSYLLAKF